MPEQITITVDEETARLYREADERAQERIAGEINWLLRQTSGSKREALARLEANSAYYSAVLSEDEKLEIDDELARIS